VSIGDDAYNRASDQPAQPGQATPRATTPPSPEHQDIGDVWTISASVNLVVFTNPVFGAFSGKHAEGVFQAGYSEPNTGYYYKWLRIMAFESCFIMRTLIDPKRFRALHGPIVLAAGFFDGVHLGHCRVLKGAVTAARRMGGQAWALTFDRHPLAVLATHQHPPLLTPLEVRLERMAACDLDGCLLIPFTRKFAAMAPEVFVASLCSKHHALASIRCGANWHFGAHAQGDVVLLKQLGRTHGFHVTVVPAAHYANRPISSTRIRTSIQKGRLSEATAMLGHPYSIREIIVRGRGVGRTLGMATANVHPSAEVLPPIGVYAVRTWIGDRPVNGVASLGFRPTFPDARPKVPILEVHLLDFAGDLYGATLDIAFLARLRGERKYPTPDALMAQVKRDIAQARRICNRS